MELIKASRAGDAEAVRKLLDKGVDIDATDRKGQTALMVAAQAGHLQIVQILLFAGADPDIDDKEGNVAASLAEDEGHDRIADLINARSNELEAESEDEEDYEEDEEDPVDSLPYARRRGVTGSHQWESFQATAVRGPLESLGQKLEGREEVGLVRRNVGRSFPRPDGPHLVLVQLEGSDWVHVSATPSVDDLAQKLSLWTDGAAINLGHSDFSGFTWFSLFERGEAVVEMGSDSSHFGDPDDEDEDADDEPDALDLAMFGKFVKHPFYSQRHDPEYWRQFESDADLLQALVREQDAYVPMVGAWGNVGERAEVTVYPEDVDKRIARVDLVVLGDPALADHNPASLRLETAIVEGNVAGVKEAIEAGANLNRMPGRMNFSAIGLAVERYQPEENRVEVLQLLAQRVPDVNDGGDLPTALVPFEGFVAYDSSVIGPLEVLRPFGLNVNFQDVRGRTPLHKAVAVRRPALVEYLHACRADPTITDLAGRTPRAELAPNAIIEEDEAKLKPLDEALAALERGDDAPDIGKLRVKTERAASIHRTKQRKSGEKLRKAFELLGEVNKTDDEDEDGLMELLAKVEALRMPERIHVEPHMLPPNHPLHSTAAILKQAGMEMVGEYGIKEMPEYRMSVLFDPENATFAACCVQGDVSWTDIVKYRADGTVLTATNAAVLPSAQVELMGKDRIRKPGSPVLRLLELTRADQGQAEPGVRPEEFTRRFEQYYQEEMEVRQGATS